MPKDNATQTGVLDQETDTGVQASPNPRYDFIEQLANNNHEVIQAELVEQGLAEPEPQAEAAPTPAVPNNAPHVLTEEELANYQVRTKIDGQEQLMPAAEALRVHQKDAAASKRLDEAARRTAELDRQEAELRQREEALSASPNNPKADPSTTLDDQANELVSALYEGDEEKTRAAVKKLLGERQPAIPQPELDIDQVAERARQKMQDDVAMQAFITDYQDVVADPFLVQMADTYRAQALRDGKPLDEALTYAGDTTREWLKAKGVTVTSNDKAARKAELDHVQAASQKTNVPEPATDGAENASDTIREMRQARGLPV